MSESGRGAGRRVQAVRRASRQQAARLGAPSGAPRRHLVLAGVLFALLTLIASIIPGFASSQLASTREAGWISVPLELPPAPLSTFADASVADEDPWTEVTVAPGQTLGALFAAHGLSATDLHRLLQHPESRDSLTRIHPGDRFAFRFSAPGRLAAMEYDRDETTRVVLELDGEQVAERITARETQRRVQVASGEINDSLFTAALDAGMSEAMILELAKVFGYDIDFVQDLRVGDRFHVVYDEVYRDGERLRGGEILAASFVNQGRRFTAFRYQFADGRSGYYDNEGRPMKKSFLRMPIDFARVSSRFTNARRHPVLGTVRAHRGVDYAANTGTPIQSAGDGRVSFVGTQNGYGKVVIVDHGRGTTTLYAHMSRFGKYRSGHRVRQGDIIGYVGATGLASGPHLHYEFRIKGVHRDPLTVTLPKPEPLPKAELARFGLQMQPMLAQLQLLEGNGALAAAR